MKFSIHFKFYIFIYLCSDLAICVELGEKATVGRQDEKWVIAKVGIQLGEKSLKLFIIMC
ncbi:hypothetical protein N186_02020 [Thermofilum adornatum]|uniref:Uncharacterized protein n=1 Tax=Thermofilum adornatum TaxID=1365176 RepID=S5ZCR9_9CREN|nr:hypothetical protein N186_02020 [Thermofilum adornatum]